MSASPTTNAWNGYYYYFGEGERCVVSFDVSACDPKNHRPSQGRRLVGFSPRSHISPQGMPSAEAYARLRAIEDRVRELLAERRVPAWLVGIHMYRGMRELLFQVEPSSTAAFDAVCAQVEEEFGGTEVVPYEGWKFFVDKIVPNEAAQNQIANRGVLEALREHGAAMDRPHQLEHTFRGSRAALDVLVDCLSQLDEGVFASFSLTARGDDYVTFTGELVLDQDAIDELTLDLRSLAKSAGVVYDGWGTMIQRPSGAHRAS